MLDETDGKPELIGDALIPLKEALESNPVDGYDDWHQLTYKGKYAGEVYLEMTFYPTTPPIKKKRSKNPNKESVRSDAMQQSQALGNSAFAMSSSASLNMTATTTRPLPEQPGAATAAPTTAPAPEPVPVSNVLPHHMQQTNISSHLQYRQNTLPLAPHHPNNPYMNYNGANCMDMSAMSRTLPNPFDYQEFGELSAIPPEHHQNSYYGNNPEINNGGYHHSNGSNVSGFGYIPEEEEDPMAIFSAPLPPGPNDAPAANTYETEESSNHYQPYSHNNSMNNSAVEEDQCHRSRSAHRYAPTRSSPLSQSTGSDLSDPETPPPAMSGSSASQLYYQEFSHHHNQQPQDPYYSQHPADDYYYHSQDQQQHYGNDLPQVPPAPPAHNSYVAPVATAAPKRPAIRRKPITRRTPGSGNSTGGELPFSAESYNSPIPTISVSPSGAEDEAEEEEEETGNRRHSAPVRNHCMGRDDGEHDALNASSTATGGAKPLPQAPACEPYVGDGQWDLSDELNAGYSDDVYGGFMQQMPVLRERASSAVDLTSFSKSQHHQDSQQQFRRSRHGDYADEYHGMEMEDGIRYVH